RDRVVAADDQFFHMRSRRHTCVFKQHATLDTCATADLTAMTYPGRTDNGGTCLDLAARTDINRSLDRRTFPFDTGIQTHPQAILDLSARHAHLSQLALQHALGNGPVIAHITDIYP